MRMTSGSPAASASTSASRKLRWFRKAKKRRKYPARRLMGATSVPPNPTSYGHSLEPDKKSVSSTETVKVIRRRVRKPGETSR